MSTRLYKFRSYFGINLCITYVVRQPLLLKNIRGVTEHL